MIVDFTLVLFNSEPEEYKPLLRDLARQSKFRRLCILISGSDRQAKSLELELQASGLSARSQVEHRYDNLGFSSGHNRLLAGAFSNGADGAVILNPDLQVVEDGLDRFVDVMAGHPQSLLQPTLERAARNGPAEGIVDSAGIGWTRDGRHFDIAQGEPWSSVKLGEVIPVQGVTGACLAVPRDAYEIIISSCGQFFDDTFVAYREDAELGVRARSIGVRSVVVGINGISHVRSVRGYARGNSLADLLGVRNRFLLKWKLGRMRPGSRFRGALRDLVVIVAVVTVERSSKRGLEQALSIRRYAKYRSISGR